MISASEILYKGEGIWKVLLFSLVKMPLHLVCDFIHENPAGVIDKWRLTQAREVAGVVQFETLFVKLQVKHPLGRNEGGGGLKKSKIFMTSLMDIPLITRSDHFSNGKTLKQIPHISARVSGLFRTRSFTLASYSSLVKLSKNTKDGYKDQSKDSYKGQWPSKRGKEVQCAPRPNNLV